MPECFKDQIFPSIPKSAFSSHRVFPSSRSWSPSRFPCVPCPLFPLEGAGSSGRAGRAAAASSSSSSSSSTAAAGQRHLRGPPEVTLGTHWGCPCPQFHTNAGQTKAPAVSTRCSKTTFGFNLSGNRTTECKAQRSSTCLCTHTLPSHLPGQPRSTGSRQLFQLFGWWYWNLLCRYCWICSSSLFRAAGLSFCPSALTCGCLTCF